MPRQSRSSCGLTEVHISYLNCGRAVARNEFEPNNILVLEFINVSMRVFLHVNASVCMGN